MYTNEERMNLFNNLLKELRNLKIDGVVQIGSGVNNFKDNFSDIDMMVAVKGDVTQRKDEIKEILERMGAVYLKEGIFRENIYLLMPFFDNGLEMDISIMPTNLLSVQSPLWKVVFDVDGHVKTKMDDLNTKFMGEIQPYRVTKDIVFEFTYQYRKAMIEVNRNNLIGALIHTDEMRNFILEVQILNEQKKLHQFKRYDDLSSDFQKIFLSTYQIGLSQNEIEQNLKRLTSLFIDTVQASTTIDYDYKVNHIISDLFEEDLM